MRYFTRGWAGGDLGDEEVEHAYKAYAKRLAEITPRLPANLLKLTGELTLHDAVIERLFWSARQRLPELSLVCHAGGTATAGFVGATLRYRGALLGSERIGPLRRAALSRETEVLYDELDPGEDGLLVHRLLFWPNEEVTIDFEQFELEVAPRPDQRVNLAPGFLEVEDVSRAESERVEPGSGTRP